MQSTETEEKDPGGVKLPIPGSQARKRKAKSNRDDEVVEYLEESQKMLLEIQGAEQRRVYQETAAFEKLLRAQQETEEQRFQAMQLQQQSSNQMILQLVNNGKFSTSLIPSALLEHYNSTNNL